MNFNSLPEAAAYWAKETPDKVCLIEAESGKEITYSEFWNLALHFSERLRKTGLNKGDRVVVRVTQGIDTLIAAFGIYMAGGIYVPIAKKIGEDRIKELLEYFEAGVFVSVAPIEYDCEYIDIAAVYEDLGAYDGEVVFPDPEEVCNIFFTTGTTGTPKGVMRTYGSYCWKEESQRITTEFNKDDIFWANPAQNLTGAVSSLRRPFLTGSTYIIGGALVFLKDFFKTFDKYGITVVNILPAELSMLLNVEEDFKHHCEKLKRVNLKSAPTSLKDMEKIKKLLPNTKICNEYGSTETSAICSYEISRYDIFPFCVGKPLTGCFIRIMDKNGETMDNSSYDNPGYITCKTPAVMKGYWNNPELAESVLKDGWLTMADMGYMDSDGFVYIVGRKDDVINSGGHKIAPGEIENLVLEIDSIKECACIPVPDKVLGNVPKLFVVMKEGEEFSAKSIHDFLAKKLERYKLPRTIECIDALPRTENNMKVKRRDLK